MSDKVRHHDPQAFAEALEDIVSERPHEGEYEHHEDGSVTVHVNAFRKTFHGDEPISHVRQWMIAALDASPK